VVGGLAFSSDLSPHLLLFHSLVCLRGNPGRCGTRPLDPIAQSSPTNGATLSFLLLHHHGGTHPLFH
jgi:hypothetical protein